MNVVVRPAVPEDAAAIAKVHIETWQSAYRGLLPDAYLDRLSHEIADRTDTWRAQISTSHAAAHEIWIAAIDDRVEGFIAFGPARDADSEPIGEVYAIYVHPRRWGQSIGRMLFSHGVKRLASRHYSTATLWVLESNARARRFYEIAGWQVDGRTKIEQRPDGIELKEVSYLTRLHAENEER